MKNLFILFILTFLSINLEAFAQAIDKFKNHSTQSSDSSAVGQDNPSSRPVLSTQSIGKLPGVEFDGIDDYFNYNGKGLSNTGYTIFIVEQRTSAKDNNYFFGTTNTNPGANEGLILGYETNTSIVFGQGSNKLSISIAPYNANTGPTIHTFVQNPSSGKQYYRNGAEVFNDNTNNSNITSNEGATIGRNGNDFFAGKLGEVIIYKRALTKIEIAGIHTYIVDKWIVEEIKEGTGCTPGSVGYKSIPSGLWLNGGNAEDGEPLIFDDCTGGKSVQGNIGPLNCKNGVYSGDTSGACVNLTCADPNILSPLSNGTWGAITTTNHDETINGTCSGGYVGSPTLRCNAGAYDPIIGSCALPVVCNKNSPGYKLIHGNWSASATANAGSSVTAACTITGGTVPSPMTCVDNAGVGNWTGGVGDCPIVYCPQLPATGGPPVCSGWGCYNTTVAPKGGSLANIYRCKSRTIGSSGCPPTYPVNACRWNGVWWSGDFQNCIDARGFCQW